MDYGHGGPGHPRRDRHDWQIRPDGLVRGVIDAPCDHDWYRVTLEPGRYIFTLSGTGDHPVGDTMLVLRDADGRVIDRNDNAFGGRGEFRLEFEITEEAEAVYLDVSSNGPFLHHGKKQGHATGDFALGVNRLDGSPLDAIAGSQWVKERVIDVYFLPQGRTAEMEGSRTIESAGWNAYQIRKAMAALDTYSEICDVRFRQTHQRSQADFELLLNDKPGLKYYGRFVPPGTMDEGTGIFASGPVTPFAAPWGARPGGTLDPGSFGWAVMVHEFGHALGLAHPHDDGFGSVVMDKVSGEGDAGAFGLNDSLYTVMSYRGLGDPPDWLQGLVTGPMAFDIAALQEMYGATRSHHGDDSYVLPTTRYALGTGYSCIWDTGGEDTIRAGRTDRDCTIDLNDATLRYEPGGGGFLSSARGVDGGFTIANGVVLENAAGGDGDDRLVGNEGANRLRGGAGADLFRGRGGGDRLDAGDDNARDHFVYRRVVDSGVDRAEADRISAFDARNSRRETTWDQIALSALDGDPDARGDQPLRFVQAFSTPGPGQPPGQVRAERHGENIHVLIDLDGDAAADMRLILVDTARLGADDFLL